MAIDNNRPPYVEWEMREQEDRAETQKVGHYVGKNVAYAIITRPGTQDSLHKEAEVWLRELKEKERAGQVPPGWHAAFTSSYKEWLDGDSGEVVSGTAIKTWPAIGPAQVKTLIAAGVKTVEDLAAMPDNMLGAIGQGAVGLKQKAKSWLEAANDTGKLGEKLAALTEAVAALTKTTQEQAKEIERLRVFDPEAKKTPAKV